MQQQPAVSSCYANLIHNSLHSALSQLCPTWMISTLFDKAGSTAKQGKAADMAVPHDGTLMLSGRARARLASSKALADCQIQSGSLVFPNLHRVVLATESKVIR